MTLAASALTTYQTAKSELGLPDDSRRSAVELLISAASDAIVQVALGRRFERKNCVELIPARGGFRLMPVQRWPLRSVTAINLLNPDQTIGYTYDPTSYVIENAQAGIIYRTVGFYNFIGAFGGALGLGFGWPNLGQPGDDIRGTPQPTTERPGLQVIYDGGFITPQQDLAPNGVDSIGQRDLPADLEYACLIAVSSMWARRGRSRDIVSETVASTGASTTWRNNTQTPASFLPVETITIARSYQMVL